ncbi:sigma-54 dependent transcriptional regulator [Cytophagaceae bacterium YF14B1]|uniref:Sigma-54 dependent transcriptional regulator n=1 Tax=Xanthocytophaga flava TaxID=3048013 RepID=A0AAE3QUZ2_9BACT|nr:sigma-54 dependent transcriptional regulator [Xanthocytophaga flavus]MDJ1483023.1 sigma-54 dependent transcriptional regulator [Xanthocytophaga flavus]
MKKKEKILIVEDEFIVANDLRLILQKAGYETSGIASSVEQAHKLIDQKKPDWVLLDIILKGQLTGIDLARDLKQKNIPFLYISANTNQSILEKAKETEPYGFLVKPFRERDLLVMLEIARYRYIIEIEQTASFDPENLAIEGIVGTSPSFTNTLEKVRIVTPTDTSVLILGESGTGKERIAQAIHQRSSRSSKPMITINCGALPLTLIESELFGHEKGSFTGAVNRRIGKFELAHQSTLFLDEIGELQPECQIKLLRVLQEKEIERLGGETTIKVDVRIIAATNRNLEKEVAEGRFRLDLYYRLNVFPITLPPLRERKEDIEALAIYFLEKFSAKTGKRVDTISPQAMNQLKSYSWPGNIRELEHLMERSVLLATGSRIEEVPLPSVSFLPSQEQPTHIKTMDEMERDHILNALKICGGKVFGPGGAAEILNLPPATLYSKMKKLGIKQGYK